MKDNSTCGCGCGEHQHEHGGCGCGGHEHKHEHGGCGCGRHEQKHEHGGCGCGGHHDHHGHHEHAAPTSLPASPEQRDFLQNFAPIAPLPIVNYLVKSSKEDAFEAIALPNVCLRSAEDSVALIKETAAFLQGLFDANLIAIDYDTPLPEDCYAHYATADSFVLFQETVAAGAKQENFLGDLACLEHGSIRLTDWGKTQL